MESGVFVLNRTDIIRRVNLSVLFKMGKKPGGHVSRYPDYEAIKRKRTLSLTDVAWERFDVIASAFGCSKSELIERLMRGTLTLGEIQEKAKISSERGLTRF